MYLDIGGDYIINTKDIIGVFDLDTSTVSKTTRDFLSKANKEKEIVYTSFELPKSFILCEDKIYISQISSSTLQRRISRY
jgi:hypothetical protein